jgi:ABC-2 type transport system ATP-binding protein
VGQGAGNGKLGSLMSKVASTVVETHGLRKQFGSTLAVADLSLSVSAGEIFGFLGPNGAGKTTSIKMLLALVEPTSGSAQVLGAPLGDRAARARIGFLPEHFRFHDTLTATELLRFHGRLYGLGGVSLDARIDHLLTRVDLVDAADRPLRGYSKGMVQRVGLAQALLNEPQIVILDEPTSGLDPLGRLLVRSLIDELRADGVAVFLNSHLLGEVEATCDRVAFVKRGRVVAERSVSTASEAFDLELRVALIGPAVLEGLARFGTDIVQPRPDTIMLRTQSNAIPSIVSWLVHQGVQIHAVQPRRKSLEDVFLEVMGEDGRPG